MTEPRTLKPGETIRPKVDEKLASELVSRLYGLKVSRISRLNSYDDQNFHVLCSPDSSNPSIAGIAEDGYVLKITNSLDSRDESFIEAQIEMLLFFNGNDICCPMPVKNLANSYYSRESFSSRDDLFAVRLLTYVGGKLLHRAKTFGADLLADVGEFGAKIDQALKKFRHPAYEQRTTLWMLNSVPKIREFLFAIEDTRRKRLVEEVIDEFEVGVLSKSDEFEVGIIHGDLNEQNLLIDEEDSRVVAVLDLGDTQRSYLVFELAIAMCYALLLIGDVTRAKHLLRGYQKLRVIPAHERKILKISVCARLCQSLVLGAYSYLNDPGNDYLLVTQKPGWAMLEKLWSMSNEELLKLWELE